MFPKVAVWSQIVGGLEFFGAVSLFAAFNMHSVLKYYFYIFGLLSDDVFPKVETYNYSTQLLVLGVIKLVVCLRNSAF